MKTQEKCEAVRRKYDQQTEAPGLASQNCNAVINIKKLKKINNTKISRNYKELRRPSRIETTISIEKVNTTIEINFGLDMWKKR